MTLIVSRTKRKYQPNSVPLYKNIAILGLSNYYVVTREYNFISLIIKDFDENLSREIAAKAYQEQEKIKLEVQMMQFLSTYQSYFFLREKNCE